MSPTRPDPDKLLALVANDRGESGRGHLKIFFGASAGVGKTYAMLSDARRLLAEGRDVVIGVVEHHERSETRALTEGLPVIALHESTHRGIKVREFDLDSALIRKPSLILMDEMAHSNAPGARHPKRWQDIEELLDNGIDVYTTLNVQHLESVNDQVARLTGVWVRETVPDSVFDAADDIALIDIPSDELLKRLADGKVYVAEGANARAAENFFKKTNLGALRELALRQTAARVDAENDELNSALGNKEAALSDKILVLVGHDLLSSRLIRHARRMASASKASWTALYLQNNRHETLGENARQRVEHNLRLAERMGAQVTRLMGNNPVETIMTFARNNGYTRIIVGHRKAVWWHVWRGMSLQQKLVESAGSIEVTTISADIGEPIKDTANDIGIRAFMANPGDYAMATAFIAAATVLGLPMRNLATADTLALLYLTAIVVIAAKYGIGPSLFATGLSIAAFNWFYTEPYYTFSFYDPHFYFTFAFMTVTSVIVGSLTARLSLNARVARKGEQETRLLYDLTRRLAAVRGYDAMAETAAQHLEPAFDADLRLYLRDGLSFVSYPKSPTEPDLKEGGAMQWVAQNGLMAGRNTDTMPSAKGLYLPLRADDEILGVLCLTPRHDQTFTGAEILVFETVAALIASALHRAQRAADAERSRIEIENEKLRNVLLASLSHDLRTPLTIMSNSVSVMLKQRKALPRDMVSELSHLWHQLGRMQKFVANLLNMAAITSGHLKLNFETYLIQEIIGAAIVRISPQKGGRKIMTHLTGTIPMIRIDGALIEQVLINLLENAIAHTTDKGQITLSVENDADRIRVIVSDNGVGLPKGEEDQIFEKFHTQNGKTSDRNHGGVGLGLAICRGIIQAHGGTIYAKNNPNGGAAFIFTLPSVET